MNRCAAWEVLVRGQGVVGTCLALALSRRGLRVGLCDLPQPARASAASVTGETGAAPRGETQQDVRAYALNAASRDLLAGLRVWEAIDPQAVTPLRGMQVQGDAGGRLDFQPPGPGGDALGWIVESAALTQALREALRFAHGVHPAHDTDTAQLVALCEGRDSRGRAERGVRWERHAYGHSALACRIRARQPHQGVAYQWFRSPDVLALLPMDRPASDGLAGHARSLVWSVPDLRADELMALDDHAFGEQLSAAAGLAPGDLVPDGPRQRWPLALARADRWCGPGWVLLGDAAHTVHPLAGQGLNLGLGDVQALADVLAQRETWRPLGDERLLRRYVRRRVVPTWAMGQVTDGLWRLFAEPAAPLQVLRNRGLGCVDALGPVKRWLTRQAMDIKT